MHEYKFTIQKRSLVDGTSTASQVVVSEEAIRSGTELRDDFVIELYKRLWSELCLAEFNEKGPQWQTIDTRIL